MKEWSVIRLGAAVWGLGLGLSASGAARAQASSSQSQQQGQKQEDKKSDEVTIPTSISLPTAEAPKVDPAEEADYKSFSTIGAEDFPTQIKSGEQFIQKYPSSKYAEGIYAKLVQAYFSTQDFPKMFTAGDKALALNPDDVSVLVRLGWVTPHNSDPNDLDAEHKLQKAEQELKHGLQLLGAMQKPAGMADDAFAKAKEDATEQAHGGLGLVYFRQGKAADSVAEFQISTKTAAPDPTDLYVMGVELQQMKKYSDAVDAFGKCAAEQGPLQGNCKQREAQAKQQAASQPPAKP